MKRKGISVAGLLLFLTIAGYSQVKNGAFRLLLNTLLQHTAPETTVAEVVRDSSKIVFLDAREPREFTISHLHGAIPVGYQTFTLKDLPALDKSRRIVVYCSVGYRSEKIAEKLIVAGFTNVSNLYGGIFEWVNQGLPVYNEHGPTQQVHAYDRTWGVWLERGEKIYD
ncbi:MAG: rhodanese-like domain-containing protein [Saprospirales bacterium]|nr:rhodanese-like domain-containing protein [Saprospirales bacterium]